MLTLTHRLPANPDAVVDFTLALTADERLRSRHYFDLEGQGIYLQLPRGTALQHGDLLQTEDHRQSVRIIAKPEPVLTATAKTPLDLLRAAYHLGNRHVPLEVKPNYLRLAPDSVLKAMLQQLGVEVVEEIAPFEPESGAYGHSSHVHPSTPAHDHSAHGLSHTH